MIGNDIIDIEYTRKHSDWTRRGFLDKVFTVSEQSIIEMSSDPFATVWRLWSMKESVYKIHFRSTKLRSFYPSSISCNILDDCKGIASLDGVEYTTITSSLDGYIFSFTAWSQLEKLSHQIFEYDSNRPKNYYPLIKNRLALDLDCKAAELDIIKNKIGIPEIYRNDLKQDVYISITHHGNFLAYSIS